MLNERGTAKVTTNHIAKAAGISPGNLYYHFDNKAHIIRAIYEQMIRDWESVYETVRGQTLREDTLPRFVDANFELLWKYRFFTRETAVLLNADPLLAQRHIAVTHERFEMQRQLLAAVVQEGLLVFPEADSTMEKVLTIGWVIANHYIAYLESIGQKVHQDDFRRGTQLVLIVFRPYRRGAYPAYQTSSGGNP